MNMLLEEVQKEIGEQNAFIHEQSNKAKEAEATMYKLKDELQVLKVAKEMLPEISGQIGDNDSNNPDAPEDEVGLIE